eukprot:g7279.t1
MCGLYKDWDGYADWDGYGVAPEAEAPKEQTPEAPRKEPKHIFITSQPGTGKTTLIHKLLEKLKEEPESSWMACSDVLLQEDGEGGVDVFGFYTEEVRDPENAKQRLGFDVVRVGPVEEGDSQRAALARVGQALPKVGKYTVDVAAFEAFALPARGSFRRCSNQRSFQKRLGASAGPKGSEVLLEPRSTGRQRSLELGAEDFVFGSGAAALDTLTLLAGFRYSMVSIWVTAEFKFGLDHALAVLKLASASVSRDTCDRTEGTGHGTAAEDLLPVHRRNTYDVSMDLVRSSLLSQSAIYEPSVLADGRLLQLMTLTSDATVIGQQVLFPHISFMHGGYYQLCYSPDGTMDETLNALVPVRIRVIGVASEMGLLRVLSGRGCERLHGGLQNVRRWQAWMVRGVGHLQQIRLERPVGQRQLCGRGLSAWRDEELFRRGHWGVA